MAQYGGFNYISDLLFLYGWAEHGLRPMLADAGLGRNGQDIYSTYPPTSSLIKSDRNFTCHTSRLISFVMLKTAIPVFQPLVLPLHPTISYVSLLDLHRFVSQSSRSLAYHSKDFQKAVLLPP